MIKELENMKKESFENYKEEEVKEMTNVRKNKMIVTKNQKGEKEMIDMEERKELMEYIEKKLWDEGFNEDGDLLVNLENVTDLDTEEIIKIVESVGLECEPADDKDYYWVSLPENFKEAHKQRVEELEEEIDFEKQGYMTDAEMCEFLDAYFSANEEEFEENGILFLDTSLWNGFIISQIIRCVEYFGYDCEYLGQYENLNDDSHYGMFIIRK